MPFTKEDAIKVGIIFGVSGMLFFLTRPGTDRKPKTTNEGNPDQQKKDANVVIDAYLMAMQSGESATRLEELNRLTEKKYGMRVYKKGNGKYYVMDTKGNDIKLK
jgi:hypothetical protein